MSELFPSKHKLLTRAPKLGSGCVGLKSDNSSVTTYDRKIENFLDQLVEGAWVCDKYECDDVMFVVRGPMCDTSLEDDEVSSLSDDDITNSLFAQAVMSQPGNGFGDMLKLDAAQKKAGRKYSSLDQVSMKEYCRLWKEKGARIGRFFNGEIVWE